jgi:hypothetical protein
MSKNWYPVINYDNCMEYIRKMKTSQSLSIPRAVSRAAMAAKISVQLRQLLISVTMATRRNTEVAGAAAAVKTKSLIKNI